MGVPTFGNLRIEAYLQLPAAFRSLSRPSSAPNAKAFSICSSSLELPYVFDPLSNLRLLRINITVLSSLSLELLCVSYFAVTWSRFFIRPWQNCLFYPFCLTKKPDFELLSISLFFPFTLSVMYVTLILLRINMSCILFGFQ